MAQQCWPPYRTDEDFQQLWCCATRKPHCKHKSYRGKGWRFPQGWNICDILDGSSIAAASAPQLLQLHVSGSGEATDKGDRQTDRQTDGHHHCIKPLLVWRGLSNQCWKKTCMHTQTIKKYLYMHIQIIVSYILVHISFASSKMFYFLALH